MSGYTTPNESDWCISRMAYPKYWLLVECKQQRTKENTLKWSRNENNAVQMAEDHVTQAAESQLSLMKYHSQI